MRLRQVLINLLSNAVKYTSEGGSVRFELDELPCSEDGRARFRISVADNDRGMSPEFLEHIFEPFTRAESSTTNKVQGTGLGMAITKNIVDLMGSTISVQSEQGKGSRFTVELVLPVDLEAEQEAASKAVDATEDERSADDAGETALAGMHFLCAEDNDLNAEILEAVLNVDNATCVICHDGEEAVRTFEQANGTDPAAWHEELRGVQLSDSDAALSPADSMTKAQDLVSNAKYEAAKHVITYQTNSCITEITDTTRSNQSNASSVFSDIYRELEICVAAFAILTLAMCILIRRAIVRPLLDFGTSIKKGMTLPVKGAGELQVLAETYNRVYEENEATQMLIKHQAKHDALTDLLNRDSYDKMLKVYEGSGRPFALILIDVDVFKSVNGTFGHAMGDQILRRVALLLKTTFRNIDHVCRIGGNEFAIIMAEMTPDLRYTIEEKIDAINEQLANPVDGLPAVSISVGVAFTDRPNPGDSIYKDADQALYRTKESGRAGHTFYGDF